jgi:hypothetical protein
LHLLNVSLLRVFFLLRSVGVGVRSHVGGKDGDRGVRDRVVAQAEAEGHLHNTHQGTQQPKGRFFVPLDNVSCSRVDRSFLVVLLVQVLAALNMFLYVISTVLLIFFNVLVNRSYRCYE